MTKLLTERQRQQYEDNGLVFPVPVLAQEEAQRAAAACAELERQLGGKPRTVEVRQMHLHFAWAAALATEPAVLDAVEDLLGPNLLIWATELFIKHPQDANVSIAWHRDCTYMGFVPHTTTTAWIALADSTVANGCMRAVPGPQRRTVAAMTSDTERGRRDGAALPAGVRPEDVVDVVLRAGEMSLHDGHILHGSGPNLSQQKRIGFVVRYITPEARAPHGRPPVLLARGQASGPFEVVEPPTATATEEALARLKESAALHFDTVLLNLRLAAKSAAGREPAP